MTSVLLPDAELTVLLPDGSSVVLFHSSTTDSVCIKHRKPLASDPSVVLQPLFYSSHCHADEP